jgi:hypothetical protein
MNSYNPSPIVKAIAEHIADQFEMDCEDDPQDAINTLAHNTETVYDFLDFLETILKDLTDSTPLATAIHDEILPTLWGKEPFMWLYNWTKEQVEDAREQFPTPPAQSVPLNAAA